MATMESALVKRIRASSAVSSIAGAKVYWGEVPQGVPKPHVTLDTVSDPRPEHLKGYQRARATRVQADCRADSAEEAKALARAVIASVEAPGLFFDHQFGRTKAEGPISLNETVSDKLVHRQSVDLIVWHVGD